MAPKTSLKKRRVGGGGSSSSQPPQPLLTSVEQERRYQKSFMDRTVVQGMYLNIDFLASERLQLAGLVKTQAMEQFLSNDTPYSPSVIRAFFTNLAYNEEELEFTSQVRGVKFSFNKDLFARVVRLPVPEPEPDADVCKLDESLAEITWYKRDVVVSRILEQRVSSNTKIYNKDLSVDTNILFYIVSHMILPKAGNYSYMSDLEQVMVYCWLQGRVIDYAYCMLKFIILAHKQVKKGLPYASAITRLLQYFNINTKDGQVVIPKSFNEYNLNRMGFTKKNNRWVWKRENEDDPIVERNVSGNQQPSTEEQGTSSSSNPMLQHIVTMLEATNSNLARMECTLADFSTRVIGIEQNLAGLSARIGKVEDSEPGCMEHELEAPDAEHGHMENEHEHEAPDAGDQEPGDQEPGDQEPEHHIEHEEPDVGGEEPEHGA